jgi:hypothetical protein
MAGPSGATTTPHTTPTTTHASYPTYTHTSSGGTHSGSDDSDCQSGHAGQNWPDPPYGGTGDQHIVITIDITHVHPGVKVTITISGISPNGPIIISIGGHNIGTFNTDNLGGAFCGISIPGLPSGDWPITVTDPRTGHHKSINCHVTDGDGGTDGGSTTSPATTTSTTTTAPSTDTTTETTSGGVDDETTVTTTPPTVTTTTTTATAGGIDAESITQSPAAGAAADTSGLAFTGAAVVGLGVLALALLGSGLALLFLGRRRRPWHAR